MNHAIELEIEITAPISWTDMVSRNQVKIDKSKVSKVGKLNATKALDMLTENVDIINANTLHKYFGWNKLYVTLTNMSGAFWSLILAYGIYQKMCLLYHTSCKRA